jgi:predicted kinase
VKSLSHAQATLHLICGKIAAGKSTLAKRLATAPDTVLLGEDHLLSRLYPGEIATVPDYVRCAARLRDAIGLHIEALLATGVSVVLDFPANTVGTREWMRGLFVRAGASHCLHYLDVPDNVCKARLCERNASGTHDFAASDAEFELITRHFVPPGEAEGFDVVLHCQDRLSA